MDEIIFAVEVAPEGGYSARALGVPIFTEADDLVLLTERTLAAAPATRSRVRVGVGVGVGGTILPDGDHSVPARSRRVDRWTPATQVRPHDGRRPPGRASTHVK